MSIYLADHPPRRTQYRAQRRPWGDGNRRQGPSGAIVVHTPENMTDLNPPDHGAENVARFISSRTDAAGSYHSVSDSDSTVQLGEYAWEMFGEGTGGNRWALHLACACKAAQWPTLPAWWVQATIANAGAEARRMADWVKAQTGVVVPARRINAAQYRRGEPGFISHGDLDPGRRSDPGADFPWGPFLASFAGTASDPFAHLDHLPYAERVKRLTVMLQGLLVAEDVDLGRSGPNRDGIDGDAGPKTLKGAIVKLTKTLAETDALESRVAELQADQTTLQARIDELLADDKGDAAAAAAYRAIEAPLHAALNHGAELATELGAIREALAPPS